MYLSDDETKRLLHWLVDHDMNFGQLGQQMSFHDSTISRVINRKIPASLQFLVNLRKVVGQEAYKQIIEHDPLDAGQE